ncbi:MAG: N-acetyltransferase family protein [Myxococcaceae bacterium]
MFTIRTATAQDAEALAELGRRTFQETFAKDNRPDDMARYLADHFGAALQREELADPSSRFLLLLAEATPAGYVKVRRGPAQVPGRSPLEICRFYVNRAWHGSGGAPALMRATVALAQHEAHDALWLAVWEHNARAIAFYQKHGFTRVGEQPFQLGADLQTDWVMAREVRPEQSR